MHALIKELAMRCVDTLIYAEGTDSTSAAAILFYFTAGTFILHATSSQQTTSVAYGYPTAPFALPDICARAMYQRDSQVGGAGKIERGRGRGRGAGTGTGTVMRAGTGREREERWRRENERNRKRRQAETRAAVKTGTESRAGTRTGMETGTGTRIEFEEVEEESSDIRHVRKEAE